MHSTHTWSVVKPWLVSHRICAELVLCRCVWFWEELSPSCNSAISESTL